MRSRLPILLLPFLLAGCKAAEPPPPPAEPEVPLAIEEPAMPEPEKTEQPFALNPLPLPGTPSMAFVAELNGDSLQDEIRVEDLGSAGNSTPRYRLTVNDRSTEGSLQNGFTDGAVLVDVDARDQFMEVAVHTPGPSSDDEYVLYRFEGRGIRELGRLTRWPSFPGDGTVLVDDWMGFWRKRDLYRFNPQRVALQIQPQEFYTVGAMGVKVSGMFSIAGSRLAGSPVLATVSTGSTVHILAADTAPKACVQDPDTFTGDFFCDWYLVAAENGLAGWVRLADFSDKTGDLPWAD